MDTIKRLKEISFNRLVHAEVAYFMSMALNEMQAVGAEALQVEPQQLEEFARLVDQLTNNLRKNTACEETGEIQQLVTQQRKLFTYLRDSCKGMQHVPLPQYSAAARQLYPQLVPTSGLAVCRRCSWSPSSTPSSSTWPSNPLPPL